MKDCKTVRRRPSTDLRPARRICVCTFSILLLCAGSTFAQPAKSDGAALHAIFTEEHLAENVFEVRRRAARLPPRERYEFLHQWVMPTTTRPHLRLEGDFTQADPPPAIAAALDPSGGHRSPLMVGGELVSPALDLVDLAKELGYLEQLAADVQRAEIPQSNNDERSREALLMLIHLASDDAAAAKACFGKLFDLFRECNHADVSHRWPETLALHRSVAHPATAELAGELLYMLYNMYVADERSWRRHGTQSWDHWFFSAFGLHKHLHGGGSLEQFVVPPPLANWLPGSYCTSMTRGKGLPAPHWQWTGQQLFKLSGHARDYLYYRIPLLGEYEVECELTLGAWRSTEILVAGTWVSPQWSRNNCAVGNARDQQQRHDLNPPLTEFDEWAHYRAVVRDGACTVFINGRVVHRANLPADPDPWLAIRSEARSHGGVQNVRITGQPVVPTQVSLSTQPNLPGWIPYHSYGFGPEADWRFDNELSASGGIVGRHQPELAGAARESLIRYHRPMFEDGAIEYEFFYEPGKFEAHPALDRLAFMLDPQGVQLHWITDGQYDRTGMAADNRVVEPEHRRGSAIPLRSADWNRLRLSLRANVVQLQLNGQLIYERPLEPTNGRTFGLFHYQDRTEARVRNVIWSGDWPRKVPPLDKQELALPDHEALAGSDTFKDVFSHDFGTGGVPTEFFELSGHEVHETVAPLADGLHVKPVSREAHTANRVTYRVPIYGDFDATLEFDNLQVSYGQRGVIGLELDAVDDTDIVVGTGRLHREKGRISAVAKMSVRLPDATRRYSAVLLADESQRGRLRLVRRGAVVHMFIAHGDSSYFRHLGSHRLPSSGTAMHLRTQVISIADSSVEVLLKRFTVRSNSSEVLNRIDPRVASVNQYTLTLPGKYRHSFAAAGDEGFVTSGKPHVAAEDEGLHLRSRGGSESESVAVAWQRGMKEDFDVAATFDLLQLHEGDELSLALVVDGKQPTPVRLVASRLASGKLQVRALVDGANLEMATVEVDSLDGLRIARVQRTLLLMFAESGFFRLLGMADIGPGDAKPGSIKVEASSHESPAAEVLLKSVEVRTTALTNP